jgi:hypothetical protein
MSFLSSPSRTRGHLLPPPHREVFSQPPRPPWPPSRPRSRPVSPPVPLMSPIGDKPAGEARTGPGAEARGRTWAGRQDPCSLLHIGPYAVAAAGHGAPRAGQRRGRRKRVICSLVNRDRLRVPTRAAVPARRRVAARSAAERAACQAEGLRHAAARTGNPAASSCPRRAHRFTVVQVGGGHSRVLHQHPTDI